MEMVFRKIEYLIEGDAFAQRALARAPWTSVKICKQVFKHALFLALSFIIGQHAARVHHRHRASFSKSSPTTPPGICTGLALHGPVHAALLRHLRPLPRTGLHVHLPVRPPSIDACWMKTASSSPTIIKRGEKRGPLRSRPNPRATRKAAGMGDCIDCRQCVAVCPTGIDIRNGTQMECVNCTACIDACDVVMDKVGQRARADPLCFSQRD